jgi:hypothetical protein
MVFDMNQWQELDLSWVGRGVLGGKMVILLLEAAK